MSKIKSIKVLNDGLSEAVSNEVWNKIESNATYQFNRSHAISYSVLSYWCMYLKTHYSPEFFAALLTTADDEDKLQVALMDALKYGVAVAPPDINLSSGRFEFRQADEGEVHLVAPFNKLKGISDKTVEAILEAREAVGGKFISKAHLHENVRRRNCNSKHMDILDKVGAFALIEEGQLPPRHPDRVKDQIELLPGLILEYVKADRYTKLSDISAPASALIRGIRACADCALKDASHCIPSSGSKIKFMVVTDSPNNTEAEEGKMLQGDGSKYLLAAIKEAGLKKSNGYFTSLVKAQKPKEDKTFTNEVLLSCRKFLDEEIAIVKPAVIVCLGGASIRHFAPDVKGSWSELAGRVIYSKELDASIIFGLNPQMCHFRDEAADMLVDVFKKVYEITE